MPLEGSAPGQCAALRDNERRRITNAAGQAAASSVGPATPAAGCAYGIPQALPGSTMASSGRGAADYPRGLNVRSASPKTVLVCGQYAAGAVAMSSYG
jgi:hypothetical protein